MLKKISHQRTANNSLPIVDLAYSWRNETSKVLKLNAYLDTSACDVRDITLIGDHQKRFYLGNAYLGIYLTQQEARCLYYFLQGMTTIETSAAMGISTITVHFYSCNIRSKIPCSSRKELLELVTKTDFIKYMEELKTLETTLKQEFKLANKKD